MFDDETYVYENERQVWEIIHAKTPEGRRRRQLARKLFKLDHPNGHRDSIKPALLELAKVGTGGGDFSPKHQHLSDIHPRAWPILLAHGKDYRPLPFRGPGVYEDENQPTPRRCYENALAVAGAVNRRTPSINATYVEGVVVGPLVFMMLHAWNGFAFSGRAVDWTFYATTSWNRYFGVPFTLAEYESLMRASVPGRPLVHLLFHKNCFEHVEERLHEVLKRPRTRLVRTKTAAGVT